MKYIYIETSILEALIKEDIPYIDLTSELLGIRKYNGELSFYAREDGIASCTEEVKRIFELLGLEVDIYLSSGTSFLKNDLIFSGHGNADKLHFAWKVCLNLLEYCCAIATKAAELDKAVKAINKDIEVVVTRKSIPGTKELVIKSAMAGGIYPHRLGLSETILVFDNHIAFLGGYDNLIKEIPNIRKKSREKKIIIEVDNYEQAVKLASLDIDGLQFDKVAPEDLKTYVTDIRKINPSLTLLAAGGITIKNASEYAEAGIDVIVTSSIFHSKPLDIKAKMKPWL